MKMEWELNMVRLWLLKKEPRTGEEKRLLAKLQKRYTAEEDEEKQE